jgi:hypothetical protein
VEQAEPRLGRLKQVAERRRANTIVGSVSP